MMRCSTDEYALKDGVMSECHYGMFFDRTVDPFYAIPVK